MITSRSTLSPPPLFEPRRDEGAPSPSLSRSASHPFSGASCGSTPSPALSWRPAGSPLSPTSPSLSSALSPIRDDDVEDQLSAGPHNLLPNEIWGEIATFSARHEILNLRAISHALKHEADSAITTMRLMGSENIHAFAQANTFAHVRKLNLYRADNASLLALSTSLTVHPRDNFRVTLMSRQGSVSEALAQLAGLRLASLLLHNYHQIDDDGLATLTACQYPIELTGNFTSGRLEAISRIAKLDILCSHAPTFDDHLAAAYALHPTLRFLLLYATPALSSRGIADLATMPTLRELVVYHADALAQPMDSHAAEALARQRALESLYIDTRRRCLPAATFCALSASETIKTLRLSICEDMHHIEHMQALRDLILSGQGECPAMNIDTARAIASLPRLRSLTLRSIISDEHALPLLLAESAATNLYICATHVKPDAMAAIMSNTRLKTLRLEDAGLPREARMTLARHPTVTRLSVDGLLPHAS